MEFFDTNDMGAYEVDFPEAHFEVDLLRKTYLAAIDEEISSSPTEITEQE